LNITTVFPHFSYWSNTVQYIDCTASNSLSYANVFYFMCCRASRSLIILLLVRFFAAAGTIRTQIAEHSILLSRYDVFCLFLGIIKIDFMFYRSGNYLQAQESEYGSYKAQTFHKCVSIVAQSCNYHAQAIRHIGHLLMTELAQTLACSLILSRIDYCNAVLHGSPTGIIQKLQ